MLIKFAVQNFLSFDSRAELCLEAGKETQHSRRILRFQGIALKLLPAAVIYGGNASGKSNFCKAIRFLRDLIVLGVAPEAAIKRVPFKLRTSSFNEPTRFEIEIVEGSDGAERIFRYTVSLNAAEILSEELIEIRAATERPLFTRRATGGQPFFELHWCNRKTITEEDRLFAHFVARGTRRNQTFLREALDRNLDFLKPIYDWFRHQLVVLEPDSELLSLDMLDKDRADLRQYVGSILNGAGTGVISISAESVPLESIGLHPKFRDQLAGQLKEGGPGILIKFPHGRRYSIFLRSGELHASRLRTFRKSLDTDENVAFDISEESDGTLRLFDLSPIIYDLIVSRARRTYFIDEMDRSLHSSVTGAILDLFLQNATSESRGQLIATIHDLQLFDQRRFRRDELWTMVRGPEGSSNLSCIADAKNLRYDKDIRKAYLSGEIAGWPFVKLNVGATQMELPFLGDRNSADS